ncbi:MAG: DoxX family protein [Chloroflexota bacterium]
MEIVSRVLYGLPMLVFGVFHFLGAADMAGMVPAYMPGGAMLWVYLTGVALIAASISIMVGIPRYLSRIACILLAVMLLGFAFMIHLPGVMAGDNPMAMPSLLKDLGLAGGAIALAVIFD